MRMNKCRLKSLLATGVTACFLAFGTSGTNAADQKDYRAVEALLKTSQSVVGESLAYPLGAPAEITSLIVTVAPGESTGVHKHGSPTFGYILSGTIVVDYANHGKREYKPGTSFMEAMDVWHNGVNESSVPCRILVVFIGATDTQNVIREQE